MTKRSERVVEALRQARLLAPESTGIIEGYVTSLESPPTTGDVARDYEKVRQVIGVGPSATEFWDALARLRDWAARVPDVLARLKRSDDWAEAEGQRAFRAEAERDAARQEADTWKGHATRVSSEVLDLRSQVATLERENKDLRFTSDGNGKAADVALARAEAAERRVQELERKGRALHDAASLALNVVEYGGRRDALLDALSANYFPPVADGPTCTGCGGKGRDVDTDEEGGTQNETHFACSTCKGSGKPATHPAPAGLLEAVGPVLKALEGYSIALAQEGGDSRAIPVWLSKAEARAIRTAAKGGEAPPTTVLDGCDFVAHRKRQVEEEKAAKWDAAVERAKDPLHLAKGMRVAMGALYSTAANSWEQMHPEARGQWQRGASALLCVLGLTLDAPPSGPGGGDWPAPPHHRCEMKCLVGRPEGCAGPEMAGIRDGVVPQRPRQPTPTPDVYPLALKEVPTGTLVATSPSVVKVVPRAQSEAPKVVLEFVTPGYVKERFRALASGVLEYEFAPDLWGPSVNAAAGVLARALAEAKRGAHIAVNGAGGWRDALLVETRLRERAEADGAKAKAEWMAWRDRCEKAETNQRQRELKAAEAMRERCVYAAGEYAEVLNGTARTAVLTLRDRLRALPLESK